MKDHLLDGDDNTPSFNLSCKRDSKVCISLKFAKHGKLVNSVYVNNRVENFHLYASIFGIEIFVAYLGSD
jgi:hypothetical protein